MDIGPQVNVSPRFGTPLSYGPKALDGRVHEKLLPQKFQYYETGHLRLNDHQILIKVLAGFRDPTQLYTKVRGSEGSYLAVLEVPYDSTVEGFEEECDSSPFC